VSDSSENRQEGLLLAGLPEELVELLRKIPHCKELQSEEAGERLFPDPAGPEEEGLTNDWKAFVQPDLQESFLSARQIVESDLQRMVKEEEGHRLTIPRKHLQAWLLALNQVRLALAATYHLGEKELNQEPDAALESPAAEAVFQVQLYGFLQEAILEAEQRMQ